MKRIISLTLSVVLLMSLLAGCGASEGTATTTDAAPSTETTAAPAPTVSQAGKEALDGKKIIFIGNSFTQAANVVMDRGFNVLTQSGRRNDDGYFYQLCKQAGMEVDITVWCFGGHNITDTFAAACPSDKPCRGESHPDYLIDPYYDYVAIQCYQEPEYAGDLAAHLQPVVDFFRAANPDVKFLLLVPHMTYDQGYQWAKDVDSMAEKGFIVCNWGGMLYDICQGNVQVPGAKEAYTRPTFVISVSASDGYHQNILAGYLTALMVYCAITGDSAVGQPYDFCYDPSVNPKFDDLEAYKSKRYVYDPYTNFDAVFQSKADMQGLQQLVDQYIEKYN